MNQKRGMFIVLSVLLLLSFSLLVSSAMISRDGVPFQETVIPDEQVQFQYTYALGIEGGDDDDAPCGAADNDYAHQSGILGQEVRGDLLYTFFPSDIETYISAVVEEGEFQTRCEWNNLPLHLQQEVGFSDGSYPGCYFFASEDDEPYSGIHREGNDCSGWYIPPGELSIIPGRPITGISAHLFTPSSSTETASSTTAASSSITQGFQHIFENQAADYLNLDIADRSSETTPSDDATCVFEAHRFSDHRGFICLEQQNQYRWYICDEEHLFEKTGDYIPQAQCYRHADCGEGYECALENICVNEAGEEQPEEQKKVWICNHDVEEGYIWEEHILSCGDEGVECDNDESFCTNSPRGTFSWMPDAPAGQKCCGDDGLEDFGKRYYSEESGGDFLCANKNFATAENDITQLSWGTEQTPCDEWCWMNAVGNAAFNIITLQKPGEISSDVVSNNNRWYECKDGEGTKGISAPGAILNPTDVQKANRFYCYKEGNRWSWADCRDPDEATGPSQNGIKERAEGDGLFAFMLSPQDPAGEEVVSVDTSSYRNSRLDLAGFNPRFLELYVRFKRLNSANLQLKISGPPQEGRNVIYYDQPILGYAVNSPLLEENRWIHLQVPLASELLEVKSLSVESSGNLIEVRNMYLSDGSSRICSGTRSSRNDQSSWLENLDYSSFTINGKKLCNALFDPRYETTPEYQGQAWLGDENLDLENYNCCGNNENEYYAGPSRLVDGKYYGCWNSEPIASGETTMNVEFAVEYADTSIPITYPPQDVTFSVERRLGDNTIPAAEAHEGEYVAIGGQYDKGSYDDGDDGACDVKETSINRLAPSGEDPNTYEEWVGRYFSPSDAWLWSGEEWLRSRWNLWLGNIPINLPVAEPADEGCWFLVVDYDDGNQNDAAWQKSGIGTVFDSTLHRDPQGEQDYVREEESQDALCFLDYKFKFYNALLCADNHYWQECSEENLGAVETAGGQQKICILNSNHQPVWAAIAETLPEGQSVALSFAESPQKVGEIAVQFDEEVASSNYRYQVESSNELVNFYFIDSNSGDEYEQEVSAAELGAGPHTLYIMAETKEINIPPARTEEKISQLNYICPSSDQSECSYPLPGEPPYTITNHYPDLYELYFVGKGAEGRPLPEKLITSSNNHFTTTGSTKARKVAQQVVFVNAGEDADDGPQFYGCQAASYIEQAPEGQAEFENLNYCSTKAEKFCAYSVPQQDQREKFTTINSWSDEAIAKVGYQPITEIEGEINNFYDSIELQLRETGADLPYEPKERNHSASVLPTRNFISNAQFLRGGNLLPHWEIRLADGTLKANLRENLVNDARHSITLTADETLRSEQIAVPAHTKLSFSANTTCVPRVKLIDKDGQTIAVPDTSSFNTAAAAYLQLEFAGACTIHSPLLQVVDDLPPVEFNYQHQAYPDEFDARAGAACCPQNYCWNGYACVEPMGTSTYLAEHIADGRDYRCIEGQWKYLPLQFDWNKEKWGFCEQPEQCLVLPSTSGGSAEYAALDFYEGHYPTCINNGEYVFDNLCNKGNWTSRTKYVAAKLLEVGENSDYVLYCTDYRKVLLEFDNRENYLGGEFMQQPSTAPTLTQTLLGPAAPAGLTTCFNTIQDPEGRRLISDEENTCINNVCVLRFKQGGEFNVAFATTVNKDITGEDSFLFALNVPQNRLNQLCTGSGDFVRCDLTGLDIPGDLWYSNKLNATIYGKQGLQITPTVVDRILTWLARFVGVQSELSDEKAFISRAQNFRDVYVLSIGDKKVRALKEVLSADKQTLLAEYEHFTTPVCDYIKNIAIPPEAQTELLEQLSGQQKIICNGNATGIQRVEAIAGLDFFWPQLTGKMRVG